MTILSNGPQWKFSEFLDNKNYLFDKFEDCIQWLGEELRKSTTGNEEAFFEELGAFRSKSKTPGSIE